jgi:hypothetical protein
MEFRLASESTVPLEARTDQAAPIQRRDVVVWLATSGGAIAWLVHLVASFTLTPSARAASSTAPLHIISGAALLVTLLAALVCLRAARRARRHVPNGEGATRDGFVAVGGLVLNVFLWLVIAAQSLPPFLLHLSD